MGIKSDELVVTVKKGTYALPAPLIANLDSRYSSSAISDSNIASVITSGSATTAALAAKPINTATQTALNAKAPLASPAFTGTPTAPTATLGTSTTQVATTAFVATGLADKTNKVNTINNIAADYSVALSDLTKLIVVNSSSTVNVTVSPYSSVAFPTGFTFRLATIGTGTVNIVDNTTGTPVTVSTLAQNERITFDCIAQDSWISG